LLLMTAFRRFLAAVMLAMLMSMTAGAAHAEMIRVESAHDVLTTVARMENEIQDRGLRLFLKLPHHEGAAEAGEELRPTVLLLFGNPRLGSALMQTEQTMGIDLPIRALVWLDHAGEVWIGYEQPADMAARHGVPADHPVIVRMTGALAAISSAAAAEE
jgi:uncharacterized protein (DUF302 family)